MIHILIRTGKPMTRKEIESHLEANTIATCNALKRLIKRGEIERIIDAGFGPLVPKYQLKKRKKKKKKRRMVF